MVALSWPTLASRGLYSSHLTHEYYIYHRHTGFIDGSTVRQRNSLPSEERAQCFQVMEPVGSAVYCSLCFLPDSGGSQQYYISYSQQIWTVPSGIVTRGSYSNSERMSGIIAPEGASSISLRFTSLSTESCCDWVTVSSCVAIDCSQTSTLGTYSGSTIPSPVISNTGFVLIQWSSDYSITSSGWSIAWIITVTTSAAGVVLS